MLDPVPASDLAERGSFRPSVPPLPDVAWTDVASVAEGLDAGRLQVVDLDPSPRHRLRHLPGASWSSRPDLGTAEVAARIPGTGAVVLTSGEGALAAFAAPELSAVSDRPVSVLAGGTATWAAAGRPLENGQGTPFSPVEDTYRRPYEGTDVDPAAMEAYLQWEYGLVAQLERDGTHGFGVLT